VCDTQQKYIFYPIYLIFFNDGGNNRLNYTKYAVKLKLDPFKYTSYPSSYFRKGYEMEYEVKKLKQIQKAMELEKEYERFLKENLPNDFNVIRVPFSGMNSQWKDLVITNKKDYILYLLDVERIKNINGCYYISKGINYLKNHFIYPTYFVFTENNDPFHEEVHFLKPTKQLWQTEKREYKTVVPIKRAMEMSVNFEDFLKILKATDSMNTDK